MKLTDKCSIRNKRVEEKLRRLEKAADTMLASNLFNKEEFTKVLMLTLELFVDAFKQLEDNTTPAKTLLDYTRMEVSDACFRVGECKHFAEDSEFVMAVMQELGKK